MVKDEVICRCYGVTEEQIQKAIDDGAKTFDEVKQVTNIGRGCESCLANAKVIVGNMLQQ